MEIKLPLNYHRARCVKREEAWFDFASVSLIPLNLDRAYFGRRFPPPQPGPFRENLYIYKFIFFFNKISGNQRTMFFERCDRTSVRDISCTRTTWKITRTMKRIRLLKRRIEIHVCGLHLWQALLWKFDVLVRDAHIFRSALSVTYKFDALTRHSLHISDYLNVRLDINRHWFIDGT